MDKYEFNIKVEQIKKLVSKSDYDTAMKIADTIDWRRVRNTNLLSMVAMVYEKNEDYQEAKEILLLAFERAPIGKRLLYKLAELALREGSISEAEAYYREFCELTPDDSRQHLLRYLILKAKGAPAQQLIHSLESYTSEELDEKWLYELAELYSVAGMPDRCVETCDRIMLMFGLGKYVDKAMELKIDYAPLSKYQMDLVENRDKYEAKLRAVEQEYSVGGQRAENVEPEEEYYDEEEDTTVSMDKMQEAYEVEPDSYDAELKAAFQEEQVRQDLAREMTRMTEEPAHQIPYVPYEPEPVFDNTDSLYTMKPEPTRVLDDIRRVGRGVSAAALGSSAVGSSMPRPRGIVHIPVAAEMISPEPIIEEDEIPACHELSGESVKEDYSYQDFPEYDQEPEDVEEPLEIEDLDEYDVEEDSRIWNHLMVEARTSEKGLEMAVEALKQIHKETGVKNSVAKITGSKLSRRGVMLSREKLFGKDLIIEEAGDMTDEALGELNELIEQDSTGLIVVLIDNPKQLEALHRDQPVLASKFECIGCQDLPPYEGEQQQPPVIVSHSQPVVNVQMDMEEADTYGEGTYEPEFEEQYDNTDDMNEIAASAEYEPDLDYEEEPAPKEKRAFFGKRKKPVYEVMDQEVPDDEEYYEEEQELPSVREESGPGSHGEEMDIDEFAQYACKYANEIDCSITGKSMLALYERIEILEEDGVPLTRAQGETLIEEAADRAERPSFGKRLKALFSSKYDKDGLLILKEEHFIY